MSLRKKMVNLILILIIATIYIIPVSTGDFLNSNNIAYDIFSKIRILFIIFGAILIITNKKQKKYTYMILLSLMFIFVLKYLIYGELDFGLSYIFATIIIFDYITYNQINYNLIKKVFNIAFYIYLLQLIIYTINYYEVHRVFRVISSFNDVNYTAYFGLCLAYYFYNTNYKLKANILFFVLLFTYSRLYILSILIYLILNRLVKKEINIKLQYTLIFYMMVQLIIIGISFYYIKIYEVIQPEYVYLQGFQRLKGLLDQSNYIRFKANILALNSISIKSFFLGLEKDSFKGLYIFANKSIFPHNFMWSMHIQYGLLVSIILISKYTKIFKKFGDLQVGYYIVLLLFHSFLGLSSFYGFDLVLQLLIVRSVSIIKRGEVDG